MLLEASTDLLTSSSILVIPFIQKFHEKDRLFLNIVIIFFSTGFPLLSLFHHEVYRSNFPIIGLTSVWIWDKSPL
ncbi:hypothetical protein B9Z55_016015 [Caenorhabditis nigoni]|uniref:Uncharacterized protein n=1 Tax=Caenorhabditis nigoni TaxID=1611254 RepID=A0A2G5UCT4_9PELO|nr:hypothetical protein B9Z55_016015 [Caenorhabditis nigoni]